MLTDGQKQSEDCFYHHRLSDHDGFCQLIVDVVAPVLNGYNTTVFSAGDYRDRFSAVAAEGKKEGDQFLVIHIDGSDNVFFSFLCV